MLSWLDPCDLVIVEGYKGCRFPRSRSAERVSAKEPLATIRIACDRDSRGPSRGRQGLPVFSLETSGNRRFIAAEKATR